MSSSSSVWLLQWLCEWLALGLLLTPPALLWLRLGQVSARRRFQLGWLAMALIVGLPLLRPAPSTALRGAEATPTEGGRRPRPAASSGTPEVAAPAVTAARPTASPGMSSGRSPSAHGTHADRAPGPAMENGAESWRSRPLLTWSIGSRSAGMVLLLLGLVGSFRTVRLLRAFLRIGWVKRVARRFEEGEAWLARWRAVCPTRRAVRVAESTEVGSPIAVGYRSPMILLPRGLAAQLQPRDLDQLGIHELAHLRRRDDWSHLLQRLLEAWLWFHPGVLAIGRRISLYREAACDDVAVRLTGRPRVYARCLTRLLERQAASVLPVVGPGAIGRPHQTERRIEMLLRNRPLRRRAKARSTLGSLILAALAVALVVVPPPLLTVTASPSASGERLRHRSSDHLTEVSWSSDGRTLELWIRGRVQLNDRMTGVEAIADGGSLKVRERRGIKVRSVTVRPGAAGLEYEHAVMGLRRELDEEARAWFASALSEVIRETGLYARERALEVLAEGGADALLDQMETQDGERLRSVGFDVLLSEPGLSRQQLFRAARLSRQLHEAEHRRVEILERLIAEGWLPSVAGQEFFATVGALPSEHHRASLVERAIEAEGVEPAALPLFYRALSLFPSEHRRDELLGRLLDVGGRDTPALLLALRATEKLPSEHRRAAVLARLAPSLSDEATTTAYFLALDRLPSEHRRDELVRALLTQQDRWLEERADALLDAAAGLPSEHRRAALISDLMPHLIVDAEAFDRLLHLIAELPSEHRIADLLEELLDHEAVSETQLRRMLQITKSRIVGATRRATLIERITDRLLA